MLNKLNTKIMIALTVILLVLISTDHFISQYLFEKEYSQAVHSEVGVIAETLNIQINRIFGLGLEFDEITKFDPLCTEVVEKYEDIKYAIITDNKGNVLFHDDIKNKKADQVIVNSDVLYAVRERISGVVVYKEEGNEYHAIITPIEDLNDRYVGAIILGIPESRIGNKVKALSNYTILVSSIIFFVSLAMIGSLLIVWMSKPLVKLERATKQIVASGTDAFEQVDIHTSDEIGSLARSFNTMATELQKTTVSKVYVDNIISSMSDALIVLDASYNIETVNSAALELLNSTIDALISRPINHIISEDAGNPFQGEDLIELLEQGKLNNYETEFETRDKKLVPVLLSSSIMWTNDSQIKNIVVTAKDITDLKLVEEALKKQTDQLAKSNAQLEEFAYIASHDLQEPLRKVMAFSQRLQDKYGAVLDHSGNDYLNRTINATKRMQTLINDLLEYSRVTTRVKETRMVELEVIAKEVVSDLEIQIERTRGKVVIESLPTIEAEPTQVRQLFQNFIGNALKFHKEDIPPEVRIWSKIYQKKKSGIKYVNLYFKDNGIGIEEQYFERIFGVFQRLHGRTAYEGTGVGLAICKKIIERHGGEIEVESKVGEGTTFIITLPVEQNEGAK